MSERRLAAIMFTDIVGYTALMGQDEANALEIVRKNMLIQKPLVETYKGKWLKEMGDGSMAQFASALDAVYCANEIQEVAKTELSAQLRIGIHLGDITIEKDEIYGDGVNVAARIESAAEPGTVFISEAVQGAIKSASDIQTKFEGEKRLKNVDGPVRVYRVVTEEQLEQLAYKPWRRYVLPALLITLLAVVGIWRYTDWFSNKSGTTILVLPLELTESDSTNQYLIRSTTEELIRNLGKIKSLTVINPITSLVFEASIAPLSDARSRLDNTDYFIRGSIEREENLVILDIGLYDKEEVKLWSGTYRDDLTNLPELTGKIAIDISKSLKVKLGSDIYSRITELKPIDPEIYELWLKALNQIFKWTPGAFANARIYLNEAVDKSPGDARTWAMLAEGLVTMGHSFSPPPDVWREAKAAALRSLQLDSLNAEAWAALAHTKTYFEWDYTGAEYAYNKANELNPSIAMNHYHYAWHLYLHDRLDEAIEEHKIAQKLDPLQPGHTSWLGWLYVEKGDFKQAMIEVRRALKINKEFSPAHNTMGYLYQKAEQYDSAIYAYQNTNSEAELSSIYFLQGDIENGMEMLQKVRSYPLNSWTAFNRAKTFADIDSLDLFFKYANYEPPHAFFPWFRKITTNPNVINDPRFKELMDKMNLPMPEGYE